MVLLSEGSEITYENVFAIIDLNGVLSKSRFFH